jgi:hypothetical protein
VRAGRRGTFSRFDIATPVVDPGVGNYSPPPRGDVTTQYALGGITYDPSARVSIDFSGNMDMQDAGIAATSASLATTTARFDALPGLSLNVAGTYGTRGQVIDGISLRAGTRMAQAGATYRVAVRRLEATVGGTRGIGSTTSGTGDSGRLESWSGQSGMSLTTPWVGLSGGFDRSVNIDPILVYGNYQHTRGFASAQKDIRRMSLSAAGEDSIVLRGRDVSLSNNHLQTFNGAAGYRSTSFTISANAGAFTNHSELGRDATSFWGGAYQGQWRNAVRMSVWVRREHTTSTQTGLDQLSIASFGDITYRYRQFRFGLEFRRTNQDLIYQRLADPYAFRGHQVIMRVTRMIGIPL